MTLINYNPYAERVSIHQFRIGQAESEIQTQQKNLDWFSHFDADAILARSLEQKRNISRVERELAETRIRSDELMTEIPVIKEKTAWGVNPLYWFSDERQKCEKMLATKEQQLTATRQKEKDVLASLNEGNAELDRLQAQLQKYRTYDPLQAQSTISALSVQVQMWRDELEAILPLKERLDEELRSPLSEEGIARARVSSLQRKIQESDSFDRALSVASTSYDKAIIHEKCKAALGESSPGKVKRACQIQLVSAERDLKKIQVRLHKIHDKVVRVIKSIVIDGNNLCYEKDQFIGLNALLAVTNQLIVKYDVLVIFDPGICELLKLKESAIASQFPEGVKVHVVASNAGADELLLDCAESEQAYVISKDRFAEYPEKSAVRGGRLIRPEMLNGTIRIYDLDVCEEYEVKP
ncbi:MAG: hypothetical protein RL651_1961 [Pseudomonadota bacterium]|jgi:hypothetical protein